MIVSRPLVDVLEAVRAGRPVADVPELVEATTAGLVRRAGATIELTNDGRYVLEFARELGAKAARTKENTAS